VVRGVWEQSSILGTLKDLTYVFSLMPENWKTENEGFQYESSYSLSHIWVGERLWETNEGEEMKSYNFIVGKIDSSWKNVRVRYTWRSIG